MGLTNPARFLRRFLLQSTFPRLSTLSGLSLLFIILFRLASLLVSFVGLKSFLYDRRTSMVFQNHKSCFFTESVKVFQKDRSWLCTFLSFHGWSCCFSAFFLQLFFLCLYPGHLSGPPLPCSLLLWRLYKELSFDWSAGMRCGIFIRSEQMWGLFLGESPSS